MNNTTQWADDHILTADDAAWLMSRGACKSALDYIGTTVAAAAMSDPWAALRYAADRLSDPLFSKVAEAVPWSAIAYASDRLTDAQFAAAVKNESLSALEHVVDRLTDEQFIASARDFPKTAQKYAPARYAQLIAA